MLNALLISLGLAISLYAAVLLRAVLANRVRPSPEGAALGAITNFFDTLGIGSFAPTMAWLKFRKRVPDRMIPCTMLVGHTPPAMAQGFIFLILLGVRVEPVLLIGCVMALLAGGLMGAPLIGKVRLWIVQSVVAVALLVAGGLYAVNNLDMMPGGGTAAGLPTPLMIIAILANFVFGVLLNFGVGNYAPTLVLLSVMGMDPRLCFPIMAAGAGLCGAGASIRHIQLGQIDLRVALGITLGGIPAVFVAAFIVRDMPLELLRWLVMVVVLYAAAVMARSAWHGAKASADTATR